MRKNSKLQAESILGKLELNSPEKKSHNKVIYKSDS